MTRDRPTATPKAAAGMDKRRARSRAALTSAMTELTLERGYSGIGPNDLARQAGVGRSTLYAHFPNLDELLALSLDRHLATLARCTLAADPDPALVRLTAHFWENRGVARSVFRGSSLAHITRALAAKFEELLIARAGKAASPASRASARLLALQLSAGQLAVIDSWLAGRAPASPEDMATHLHVTGHAVAASLR